MADTPEQQARDLLERMEVPDVHRFTTGELVELANLIAAHHHADREVLRLSTQVARMREALHRVADDTDHHIAVSSGRCRSAAETSGGIAASVTINQGVAIDPGPDRVPVFLEGRLTVDGPGEPGPLIAWVRRG